MNVWISLLLLYAQFTVGLSNTVDWTYCPVNCSCSTRDVASSRLTVDCQARTDVDQLADQLDLPLSSNLTSLSIVNSPLTQVPRSICRLTTLKELHLDNNKLTRLPDNCLSNLSNLERFSAHDNAIETLQDGVFDGLTKLRYFLTKLRYLNLNRNRISSIGLSVFATSSNLSSLFNILLSENNLTSLEPWSYDRGIIGNTNNRVYINLTRNKISKFTNRMGFHVRLCHTKIPFADVFLQNNNIKHFADILKGWQLSYAQLIGCFRLEHGLLNYLLWTDDNKIKCDCVNYYFYRIIALRNLPRYIIFIVRCNLIDPLTGTSSNVDGLHADLKSFVCELTERCPARCVCVHRPHNATLHVYCSNKNLTDLPLELSELPDTRTKYKLDFSKNRLLQRLEYRDYFVNTSILDVSNSGVDDIEDWEEIAKIPAINIFGNKISSIPPTFLLINITTEKLSLANNPWDCSCDNKWMSNWFISIANRLTQKVLCYSPPRLRGTNIAQASDEEFCVDPASEAVKTALAISLSTVVGVFLILLCVCIIVYRLRVKVYTRWKFHPFDRDECLGEDMDYDVFLSCSSNDNLPHGNGIRVQLERHGYRVCYPPRDFLAGDTIQDNICNAIVRSKRTVCLLTEHFLQSAYCMYEFDAAFHHNIVVKRKKRLIVLMALDSPNDLHADDDSQTTALRHYLRQYTYIDFAADDWLDNLLYGLPLHGMD